MSEDLIVLREILQRELETINAYERMLARVSDPHLREIIDHVTDEEREHVSEMYQLIMERDPKQVARAKMSLEQLHPQAAQAAQAGGSAVVEAQTAAAAAGLPGGLLSARPSTVLSDPTPPPPPIFPDGAWSVGSLKRGLTP